jgi:hypothetical protein
LIWIIHDANFEENISNTAGSGFGRGTVRGREVEETLVRGLGVTQAVMEVPLFERETEEAFIV